MLVASKKEIARHTKRRLKQIIWWRSFIVKWNFQVGAKKIEKIKMSFGRDLPFLLSTATAKS